MDKQAQTRAEIERTLGLAAGTIQPRRSLLASLDAAENKRSSAPVAVGGFVPLPLPSRRYDIRERDEAPKRQVETKIRVAPAKKPVDLPTTKPVDRSEIFDKLGLSPQGKPLEISKPAQVGMMARQLVQGKPLCTMRVDDKTARDQRSMHRTRFGAGL